MSKILVLAERAGARIDDVTWELLGAARSLAGGDGAIAAAILGRNVADAAADLARGFADVHVFDDARLADPDGEVWGRTLAPFVERGGFDLVLLAHTNGGIDLAPALSVRVGAALLPECLDLARTDDGRFQARRAVYGGKIHARIATRQPGRVVATLRGGAFEAAPPSAEAAGSVHSEAVPEDISSKRRTVATVEPEAGDVDITQAEILVAVGRGIEDEENLEIVQALAKALGGEVACSRPVVDKGWLPKSRQVGTSGLTVKPRVYLAVGISGSFQHLGGIKGAPYLVAINKDPRAPIFGVADVGIVGDLFDVVPALEEKVREVKGA